MRGTDRAGTRLEMRPLRGTKPRALCLSHRVGSRYPTQRTNHVQRDQGGSHLDQELYTQRHGPLA